MENKTITMAASKRIALIAHDNMKSELMAWCTIHRTRLVEHSLYATGTTGHMLEKHLQHPVEKMISGPLGGDQQIGAMLAQQQLDMVIFFWDPFEPMPHDPDVKALLRVAAAWNTPVACNRTSADFMISSPLFNSEVKYDIPDYDKYIESRFADGSANS